MGNLGRRLAAHVFSDLFLLAQFAGSGQSPRSMPAIRNGAKQYVERQRHGVDEQGDGTLTEQRLYQLIRQPTPIVDRQFEIEFLDPGVEVFAFTFG